MRFSINQIKEAKLSSKLFESMGIENIDFGIVILIMLVIIIALIIISILNNLKISRLTKRYSYFMKGRAAKSLEDEIYKMFEQNASMQEAIEKNRINIKALKGQIRTTYQKLGVLKYDAFDQMGGKLSFCLALLDESNNGFILNSIHATDSNYVYIKEIEGGVCRINLGDEEAIALKQAMSGENNEAD